nr:hypothetical protein [Prevotella corporis]
MDTIVGRGNHGAIVTLIERSTNMLFMRKLKKGKECHRAGTYCNTSAISIQRACQVYYNRQRY